MAGWICVPLDIRWKQDELKERIAISNPDVIVTERYKEMIYLVKKEE